MIGRRRFVGGGTPPTGMMQQRRGRSPVAAPRSSAHLVAAGSAVLGVALLGLRRVGAARRRTERDVEWFPSVGAPSPGPLAGRVVGSGDVAVVLVHGMFNASSYWGGAYDRLTVGHAAGSLLAVDLAGFGRSLGVASGYGPNDQADAVAATLTRVAANGPVAVGAHSIGTIVALALAARHPHLVAGIAAFSPPWYEDRDSARDHLAATDPLARLFLSDATLARWSCRLMCRYRDAAATVVRLVRPNLPGPLAADRVRHTWTSYSESLRQLVLAGNVVEDLGRVEVPVHAVIGSEDEAIDAPLLHRLATQLPNLTVTTVSGVGHDLPLSHPSRCIEVIAELGGEATTR